MSLFRTSNEHNDINSYSSRENKISRIDKVSVITTNTKSLSTSEKDNYMRLTDMKLFLLFIVYMLTKNK